MTFAGIGKTSTLVTYAEKWSQQISTHDLQQEHHQVAGAHLPKPRHLQDIPLRGLQSHRAQIPVEKEAESLQVNPLHSQLSPC
ncbi:hypothetical protein CapIbe_011432 [Capra ibex]